MNRRICVLLAAAVVGTVVAALPSVAAAKSAAPHYYLSLGDSLSQGMQPDLNGVTRDTNQGYANDLLAIERRHVHNLKLVQLGCGGDTTTKHADRPRQRAGRQGAALHPHRWLPGGGGRAFSQAAPPQG